MCIEISENKIEKLLSTYHVRDKPGGVLLLS